MYCHPLFTFFMALPQVVSLLNIFDQSATMRHSCHAIFNREFNECLLLRFAHFHESKTIFVRSLKNRPTSMICHDTGYLIKDDLLKKTGRVVWPHFFQEFFVGTRSDKTDNLPDRTAKCELGFFSMGPSLLMLEFSTK